jgi:hypothetical protein
VTEIPFRVEPSPAPGDAPLEYGSPQGGRVRLTVRLGERPTGGHSITVLRITREGSVLTITCEAQSPPPGAIVTQVLTSPAQTVSIDESSARGTRVAVLLDQTGAELARISA